MPNSAPCLIELMVSPPALASPMTLAFDAYATRVAGNGLDRFTATESASGKEVPLELHGHLILRGNYAGDSKSLHLRNDTGLNGFFAVTNAGFDRTAPRDVLHEGMEILREYLDAEGQPVKSVKTGDEITVRLRMRAIELNYIPNVALTDLLPGGFEPVLRSAADPRPAQMIQKNKRFTPHVLAIPVGSAVSFPNFDPIFHNAFSNFNGQIFDVGLYKPGSSRTVEFKREGFVRVFCNIHPQMSAVIVVLKTPYFAVSDQGGAFRIPDVPAGQYELHVFHERAPTETLRALNRKLTVENAALEVPPLAISESRYLQVAHKNKFGKDYPPVTEEQPTYSGVRK